MLPFRRRRLLSAALYHPYQCYCCRLWALVSAECAWTSMIFQRCGQILPGHTSRQGVITWYPFRFPTAVGSVPRTACDGGFGSLIVPR